MNINTDITGSRQTYTRTGRQWAHASFCSFQSLLRHYPHPAFFPFICLPYFPPLFLLPHFTNPRLPLWKVLLKTQRQVERVIKTEIKRQREIGRAKLGTKDKTLGGSIWACVFAHAWIPCACLHVFVHLYKNPYETTGYLIASPHYLFSVLSWTISGYTEQKRTG